MRLSMLRATTTPWPTAGADRISLDSWAFHSGLPSMSKASSMPLAPPTTMTLPSVPTPAVRSMPAFHAPQLAAAGRFRAHEGAVGAGDDHGIAGQRGRELVVARLADIQLPGGAHGHRAFQSTSGAGWLPLDLEANGFSELKVEQPVIRARTPTPTSLRVIRMFFYLVLENIEGNVVPAKAGTCKFCAVDSCGTWIPARNDDGFKLPLSVTRPAHRRSHPA
jgi:hypothetical protein